MKILDFKKLIDYVKLKLQGIPKSEHNISLIIDIIAFYVPQLDKNAKIIYDLKYDLKCSVLDHFPTPTGLGKLIYKVFNENVEINDKFKQTMYYINFDEKHKKFVESCLDKIIITENRRVKNNEPYTKNIELNILLNKIVSPLEIKVVIKNLKNAKSPGPDNIFNEFVKNAGININNILSELFNKCVKQHIFPPDLKFSNIIPLYKKRKRNVCNNYRPVKLLSIIGKYLKESLQTVYNHSWKNIYLIKDKQVFALNFQQLNK